MNRKNKGKKKQMIKMEFLSDSCTNLKETWGQFIMLSFHYKLFIFTSMHRPQMNSSDKKTTQET